MSIFRRIFKMAQAESHAALDQFEDPIKMTEQGIRQESPRPGSMQSLGRGLRHAQRENQLDWFPRLDPNPPFQTGPARLVVGRGPELRRLDYAAARDAVKPLLSQEHRSGGDLVGQLVSESAGEGENDLHGPLG